MEIELKIGGLIRLKKQHPCGESIWKITRLGADIGMICQGCEHHILMPRQQLARRIQLTNAQ